MMNEESSSTYSTYPASAREAAFEQLLRLAASYASTRFSTAQQNGPQQDFRKGPFSDDIAVRAYHIYLNRGATNGHDLDDWLQAEREVMEELRKNRASLRLALAFGLLKDSTEKNS
jgi:hypothetical protein